MCVKLRGHKIGPGSVIPVTQRSGVSSSIWGFNSGDQYNARSERLNTLYSKLDRGFIQMDSFWEGKGEFRQIDGTDFSIAVVLNKNNEFAILTREANGLVKPYHHRMPVLLSPGKEELFLDGCHSQEIWLPEHRIVLKAA